LTAQPRSVDLQFADLASLSKALLANQYYAGELAIADEVIE
jgi:hypothetical protein